MSTIMQESTTETEDKSTIWENISWRIGYRTNMLGEYLVKLGEAYGRGAGLDHHDGRVGSTLSAMLTASKITVEDLAAKTNMTADRVRDLADDDFEATQEEVRELARGWYLATNAKRLARQAATV